jgi:hypothetical protein
VWPSNVSKKYETIIDSSSAPSTDRDAQFHCRHFMDKLRRNTFAILIRIAFTNRF